MATQSTWESVPPTHQSSTMKHNNMIVNEHFRKYWQRYVKTWFDQPAKKKARRLARAKKAAAVAPRPVAGALRSVVFPKHAAHQKKGWVDTSAADTVVEQVTGKVMSDLPKAKKPKARAITAEEAGAHTVRMLKAVRNDARLAGYREVQRKAKAEKAEQDRLKKAK